MSKPREPEDGMPRNAFDPSFLERLREMDDPSTAGEGELSGPWKIVELEEGYGLFRAWESPEAGHQPYVVCGERERALLFLSILPACGRAALYRASGPRGPRGFPLESDGAVVGSVQVFDETLLLLAHGAEYLVRSPLALAGLLRAAGPLVMRQVGEIVYQEYFPGSLGEQER